MGGYGYGVGLGQRVSPGEMLYAQDVKAPRTFGSRVHPEGILYPGNLMSIEERMIAGGKLGKGLGQIYDRPLAAYVSPGASFEAQVLTELMPVHPRVVGQGRKGYPEVGPLGLEYRTGPPETYTVYGGSELGIVGVAASVGLKAAMPSITKSIKGVLTGKSGKAARANRTAAQDVIVDLHETVKAIADGTDELVAMHNQGQRVDPMQIQEADVVLQGIMQAWGQSVNNYAALAGTERMGQGLYPSSAVPFYMQGRNRMGQLYKARQQGNAPAHESDIEYERFFLRGYGISLGRSAGEKRTARLGWLKQIQANFFTAAKRANANLDKLFKAYSLVRNTPTEARAVIDNIPEEASDTDLMSLFTKALTSEEKTSPVPQSSIPPAYATPPGVQPATQHGAPAYPSMPGMPGYEKKKSPIVPVAAAAGGAIGLVALLKILGVF